MSEVMNEFRRLRIRNELAAPASMTIRPDDPPTMVGKVVTPSGLIGVGKFLLVNPVNVLGTEVEGGAGAISVDATTVPVLLVGPAVPATGEFLICRYVQHRWVADRTNTTGAGTPILIGIPGCFCQGAPATLSISVTFGPGETAASYGGAYRSGSLIYCATTAPGYLPQASFAGAGYYSTTSWVDNSGTTNYYRLSCSSTQYSLGLGQLAGGRWQSPGQFFTWAVGSRISPNVCSPFLLAVGQTQPGVYFNGNFTVSG